METDDLTVEELNAQLELAGGAFRFVARYQAHHGQVPFAAVATLDWLHDYSKGLVGRNGPSELTRALTREAEVQRQTKPRARSRRPRERR